MLEAQRVARAEDDLVRRPDRPQLILQIGHQRCRHLVGENDDVQPARADPLQKALDPPFGQQDLADDGRGAVAPAEDQDVAVGGDRRQPRLQPRDEAVQPLGHDRDQGAHEQHVAEHGHQRRQAAPQPALVIPQVAGIAEAQKAPPGPVPEIPPARFAQGQNGPGGKRDQHDQPGDEQQLIRRAAENEALQVKDESAKPAHGAPAHEKRLAHASRQESGSR